MGWKKSILKREREVSLAAVAEPTRTGEANPPPTVLGKTLVVNGHLHSDEDMLVAGRIKGEVSCGNKVTVAPSGVIEGSIQCKTVVISGVVEGNIDAKEAIIIEASGKLKGDITTKILTNQPGGFFEGYSHMIESKTRPAEQQKSTPPSSKKNKGKQSQEKEGTTA